MKGLKFILEKNPKPLQHLLLVKINCIQVTHDNHSHYLHYGHCHAVLKNGLSSRQAVGVSNCFSCSERRGGLTRDTSWVRKAPWELQWAITFSGLCWQLSDLVLIELPLFVRLSLKTEKKNDWGKWLIWHLNYWEAWNDSICVVSLGKTDRLVLCS